MHVRAVGAYGGDPTAMAIAMRPQVHFSQRENI